MLPPRKDRNPLSETGFEQPVGSGNPMQGKSEKSDDKCAVMNDGRYVTHYKLDARLSAAEARMDARIDRIETLLEKSAEQTQKALAEMHKSMSETKASFRWMYWTLVAIIIASVFAIWQTTRTTVPNAISAMDYGRVTAERNAAVLEEIRN